MSVENRAVPDFYKYLTPFSKLHNGLREDVVK